ncbi:archease [Halorubrum sp. GN11_10-6_MGM]|uniref:archease n=1 Tax=Halorubrum sp. GN11_10-6_MGM TaxID=2518112 RepID=UPI0010F44D5B|nr:archease [Halorubrum sp. GN11_10-6_MGM]TKX74177.1 archease [Halorubrum sp. GN11_10-6_MGM]
MTYELRDHTADVAVEATADDLSALFAAVADGLTAASAESVPETGGDRFEFEVAAESREALLFDYLDQLIYERDVRLVLPADHRCTVVEPTAEAESATPTRGGGDDDQPDERDPEPSEWRLTASARGVPLDAVAAREIKAVTYSEMALERRGDGWYAYVVLDV